MSCPHCSKVKSPFCPECGAEIEQLTKEQKLAETLHKLICTCPFECGWPHENDDWSEPSHKQHLRIATKIFKRYTDDDVVVALSILSFCKKEI